MYVAWDAPADNTDKLQTWEDGSLCENKSWATSIGLCAINNGRLLPSLGEPASQETSAGVCCSVDDGGRGKWSVREDSGDPVVSLAISPCVAASFSRRRCSRHSTPRRSHWGQFKVSSIHLLLFQMWTWLHSLCGFRWRMPRKNSKEHRHGGPSHSLAKGKALDYCSKTSNARNGNDHEEWIVQNVHWTSETAVRHLINAPWRQVLCNMEISQSCQKESYCTHCCPTGWWLFMVHLFSVLPLWYDET